MVVKKTAASPVDDTAEDTFEGTVTDAEPVEAIIESEPDAPEEEEEDTPTGRKQTREARTSPNAWWCPWDDMAQPITGDVACPKCGAVLRGGKAIRYK